ncbi:S-formylglutathione hydrolase [Reinekea thalattae]|uniref:S-formylglutathione hydrolase n=1 Tax=Reinekea thalattae TaxID=2593301 RepID=A0A5C8Z770_9GAMM|nr:S-formylglutathione hydrolase [Reinekea thalattae]TXR53159.1 S-formylglutathione hydrolase [Reinekea thalattae]
MQLISSQALFAGKYQRYQHTSAATQCDMVFSIYLPPAALAGKSVPVLYWLSGLTCTDENFMQKAGAQRIAAELGIALVAPDTSPRGEQVPDDADAAYDMGLGAGFYLNATQPPWNQHYQIERYIVEELPACIESNFPVTSQASISGHSMGGHGALTLALKNPKKFKSVSAFSPIVSPMNCPWGVKALSQYLGDDQTVWQRYDSCALIEQGAEQLPMLIDQGSADDFLEAQLKTELLLDTLNRKNYKATVRMQPDYDHSYYFIATFIEEHLRFHAGYLLD